MPIQGRISLARTRRSQMQTMDPQAHSRDTRRDALTVAVLVLCSLAFYLRVLGFDFVSFDDPKILLEHGHRYAAESFAGSLRQIFLEDLPREEPLVIRDVSWALDSALFGFANPVGYHAGNWLLNALVVGLLFLFLRRSGLAWPIAAGVSLAFAVVAIHVEPVAWVMGRKDLLAAFFMLAGLLAQTVALAESPRAQDGDPERGGSPSTRPGRRVAAYAVTLLCAALALGSKISAISYFLVLALHRALWPALDRQADAAVATDAYAPSSIVRRAILPIVPHALLSIGVFVWYRGQLAAYGVIHPDNPGATDPEHLRNVVSFLPLVAGEYLKHLFWPQDLSAYYRWPHVEIPLGLADAIAALGWALALVGLLVFAFWRRRDLAFFGGMTLLLMLPYTGLFYVGFWHADRYFYLASAGVLAIAGILLGEATRVWPRLLWPTRALVAVFVLSNAAYALQQQGVWRDTESLWTHEIERFEPSLLAFSALAREYVNRAEEADAPQERAEYAALAHRIVDLGFERESELDRQPTRYRVPEQAQLADLHVLRGRLARLRGATPAEQAEHFRLAYELAPQRGAAMLASESLYNAAASAPEGDKQKIVSESFDYFMRFVAYSVHDPRYLAECELLLDENFGEFPHLFARIAEARRVYFQ